MKRGECFGSLETGGLSVLRLDDNFKAGLAREKGH